jgi:hypothetical protein
MGCGLPIADFQIVCENFSWKVFFPRVPLSFSFPSQKACFLSIQLDFKAFERNVGCTVQDRKASDSMAKAMDLMQVNPFVRKAIILMNGLRLKQTVDEFALNVLTVIPGYVVWPAFLPLDRQYLF